MRIAKFINEIVGQRRVNGDKPSAVVMKLDDNNYKLFR